MLRVAILIFEDFEILDVCGPIEMLGMYPESYKINLVARQEGIVSSAQGVSMVAEHSFETDTHYDVILVPGGHGTRREVNQHDTIDWLKGECGSAKFVTSVCTGAALLARAGALDGKRATTNKMNFEWVRSQGPHVSWEYDARWVEDAETFTSSGVSAGMDMTLALIQRTISQKAAEDAAAWAEYDWHHDPSWDPFAEMWRNRTAG